MPNPSTTRQNAKSQSRRHSGLNVYDILFVLFKHKWKILFFSLLGIAGGAVLIYLATRTPIYESQAKLLVRYVLERSAVDPYESKSDAAGNRGMAVMDAEMEIIRSSDLILEVATKIGPEKILTNVETPPTNVDAARQIVKNLQVSAARGSNVIHLTYQHRDPTVAGGVLKQLIETYFEKHLEIHRSTGAFESVARQTDQARSRLSQTEAELSKLSSESGFLSLADAKSALEARRNAIRSNLMAAQVELAEQQAKVASLAATIGVLEPASPTKKTPTPALEESMPERMARIKAQEKFRDLSEQLTLFKQRRNTVSMSRKPSDPMMVALDRQIASVERQGLELIEEYPGLASQARIQNESSPLPQGDDLNAERAIQEALVAKTKMLAEQVAKVDAEVEKISASSLEFANLERRRQMEEEKYRYFETSLEKARVDEALNPASMPNIGVVQSPSAAATALPAKTMQLALGLAAGGLLIGLSLAFLFEWVINRRISRPIEIQTRLQLPLMMTIPRIRTKDGVEKLINHESACKLLENHSGLMLPAESSNGVKNTAQYEPEHFIMPFAGALRDRIMFGFEINNITHKPKMIGLTGLSQGAGTSTLAVAMAKSFAENGKFKVLVVDLNSSWSSKLPDAPVESLHEALEVSRSATFRQHPRSLYFASAPTRQSGKGSLSLASVLMHELLPQLVVCDFDYIVFDMPPVAPTSPTLAMAGFMDKVLLVLDAENTNRESLSWSYGELEKGRADVSCVFNKAKSVAPRWVEGEV
jgi:polysaccharide biosynthesis transport protein